MPFLKKCIYKVLKKEYKEILLMINDKSVVSFDVFDTLLKREVASPRDVFRIMELHFQDNGIQPIKGFSVLREAAEEQAKKEVINSAITIEEIYDYIPVDNALKAVLIDMECEIELQLSFPNLIFQLIYDACIEQGKDIYFISDMYLHYEIIEKMLKKAGYNKGKLYVSSEIGKTKYNGELFSYIRDTEKINTKNWIHIGDSVRSDYLMPKRLGINAILIERAPKNNKYYDKNMNNKNKHYMRMNHFINTHISEYQSPYEKIGYAVFGPLLYGFSCWLAQKIPENRTILFLARDGAVIRRAFQIISKRSTLYLYISRKSVYGAYLSCVENTNEIIKNKFPIISRRHTTGELAISHNISESKMQELFEKNGIEKDEIIISDEIEKQVLDTIWPVVKNNAKEQYQLFQEYLNQLGVSAKCAVIDVGWRGTTQTLLQQAGFKVGREKIDWEGYYFGIHYLIKNEFIQENKNRMFGFLYKEDSFKDRNYIREVILGTIAFFEMFFLSTEGTTKQYIRDNDGIVRPVIGKKENNSLMNENIDLIQNAALDFVSDLNQSTAKLLVNIDSKIAFGNYLAFVKAPTKELLRYFNGYNCFNGDTPKIFLGEHGSIYYLRHPRQLYKDLIRCDNRALFLKRIFKIPLPYFHILYFLRKFFDKT
ncbi:HAD family hydrolase [Zhenpiania hominis]|nr:HAD-IA family hydrolase [Zhenpiania hominis]